MYQVVPCNGDAVTKYQRCEEVDVDANSMLFQQISVHTEYDDRRYQEKHTDRIATKTHVDSN